MQAADFEVLLRILGMKNWEEMARALDITSRHLRRYRRGEQEVPRTVKLALEALICRKFHQHLEPGEDPDRFSLEESYTGVPWT